MRWRVENDPVCVHRQLVLACCLCCLSAVSCELCGHCAELLIDYVGHSAFGDRHVKAELATVTHKFEGRMARIVAASVIVASDGLWEYRSEAEIAHRVQLLRGRSATAAHVSQNLTAWASKAWHDWEGPGERDDITVVVLFVDGNDETSTWADKTRWFEASVPTRDAQMASASKSSEL